MSRIKDFFRRINRAVTEVGIEHFSDDKDWDERVKLPAWQTARLRERYERKKAKRVADNKNKPAAITEVNPDEDGKA